MSPKTGLILAAIVLAASLTTMVSIIMQQSAYADGASVSNQKCQAGGMIGFPCHVVQTPSGNTNVQGHNHPK